MQFCSVRTFVLFTAICSPADQRYDYTPNTTVREVALQEGERFLDERPASF